ncbi:hypothetical protein [Parasediminibacterium sp. JCM 36343]|uniref:hypothetical protein n=1 Tax=Parasediminibacterium sp. JCM 36343 TaxID=3374279 RepID=UPI0039788CFF
MIWLCVYIYYQCQCSYRACSAIVAGSALLLGLRCRKPSASSIRNWVVKTGYYVYCQPPASGDWCLLVDESVSIGRERLLLILGVPLGGWGFSRPLSQQDTRVLYVGVAESWKSTAIEKELLALSKKLKVGYCLSDRGNNIVSAVKRAGMLHIHDCSHEWANHLETCYAGNEDFKGLMDKLCRVRKKWVLSKYSHLMPPKLRSKARFLNVFPLIEWIENILGAWGSVPPEAQEELSFLDTYKPQIEEWVVLKEVIKSMSLILKTEGMNKGTIDRCRSLLDIKCTIGATKEFSRLLQQSWEGYADCMEVEGSN